MKTYTFSVKMHEEYGTLGYAPTWYPNGDPLSGMAVAHDILEHFPHDPGDAEGEFQAFGAGLFIRGDTGYFGRNGNMVPAEEHLASEIGMVWGYHTGRDNRTTLRPCGVMKYHETMDQCRKIALLGMGDFVERGEPIPSEKNIELIARWIARGYKRASIRYAKHDAYEIAYQLFEPIETQADALLKHADEGMVLTVHVDLSHLKVALDVDYPREEEY